MKGLALVAAVGTTLVVLAGPAATPGADPSRTSSPGPVVAGPVAVSGPQDGSTLGSPVVPGGPRAVVPASCDGVAVVVDGGALDTGPLGRASALACAPVDGTVSVLDAAAAAGVELQGTEQWGTAFVCRVDGRPAVDEDVLRADGSTGTESCVRTPSQGAYWALWTAPKGSTWVYATSGVTSLEVAPGDAVGLVFVTSDAPGQPRVSPADALSGAAPAGWTTGGRQPVTGAVPEDVSPSVDGLPGAVALVGLGSAAALLALAGLRARRS